MATSAEILAKIEAYILSGGRRTLAVNLRTILNDLVGLATGGPSGATNLGYTTSTTNGKVTSDTGTDATIPLADSTNAGLLKPDKFIVLENTSGTNTGNETAASIGAIVNSATDYATPLNADKIGIWDSLNSLYKDTTWINIKITLKTYFDTLYARTRVTFGNADYNALITDREIVTSVAFTAPRTVTLIAGISSGIEVIVADEFQTVTSTNTLTIAVPVGKKLNGVTNGTEIIKAAGGWRRLISDGSDNYIFDAGIARLSGATLIGELNFAPSVSLSSATNPALGATNSNNVTIIGNTTIAGFDTVAEGITRRVKFAASLQLTYNLTSFILPGSSNITTSIDDEAIFVSLGAGNWKCISYTKRDGTALSGGASATTSTAGIVQLDTDGNIQSNTNSGRVVTSGNLAAWWPWIKTQAQTFSALITFGAGFTFTNTQATPSGDSIYRKASNQIAIGINGEELVTLDATNGMTLAGSVYQETVNAAVPSGSANFTVNTNLTDAFTWKDVYVSLFRLITTTGVSAIQFLQEVIISGGFRDNYQSVSASTTLARTYKLVGVNATGGVRTITLPTAVGFTGRTFEVMKTDSSGNAVTVATTSSQTINAASTDSLASQFSKGRYVSDGANWLKF